MGIKSVNEKGLTLLEVLLSIVLLFIVLTSFASFFTQSAIFIKKNEEKLSTSQTAQQIVNLIEVNLTHSILETNSDCMNLNCTLDKDELSSLSDHPISSTYDISADFTDSVEGLVQVKITVTDLANPDSSSETFTYIRR